MPALSKDEKRDADGRQIPVQQLMRVLGGAGSGNFGHSGRPGEIGGSGGGGEGASGGGSALAKAAEMGKLNDVKAMLPSATDQELHDAAIAAAGNTRTSDAIRAEQRKREWAKGRENAKREFPKVNSFPRAQVAHALKKG